MPKATVRLPWTKDEVEAIVADYFSMLAAELAGRQPNKAAHRRALLPLLQNRNESAVEFKHSNISAVLIELGFPYIAGYRPHYNYQELLYEVVRSRLATSSKLHELAASDAEAPVAPPITDGVLLALTDPPRHGKKVADKSVAQYLPDVNYLEREARNRALGLAGEELVIAFERARLHQADRGQLAVKIRHVSKEQGDYFGYDILSFEESGLERLIEVKTTKRGIDAPFFVTRNELRVSEERADIYHLYRVFDYRADPRLFTLNGALSTTCALEAVTYQAFSGLGAA